MKWTQELLDELKEAEDAISALECGYYDFFDIEYIEENEEEFRGLLEKYKSELPKDTCFCMCKIQNNKLVKK